ncbi:MAG: M24 family metallopeptidase [bacterium]|nr:M24 family metallopeptidase [bacterium]
MALFDSHAIADRRTRVARAFGDDAPIVLMAAGEPIPIPGGHDQVYSFIPHPHYFWLTGSRRWGGVLAYDPVEGWTHFVRPVSDAERLWEGVGEGIEGEDIARLSDWLADRKGRSVVSTGAGVVRHDGEWALEMAHRLDSERRHLDAAELAFLGQAIAATAAGHVKASEVIRPGRTERQVQLAIEHEMKCMGAHAMGYGTIVGAGDHAAVLHFEPGDRVIGHHDLVLVDAGGAVNGYTADVTRTYPAGDAFTPEQQAIYDIVADAETAAIAQCRIGVEWHAVHRAAARIIAGGLRDLQIFKGSVDALLESGAVALFFPHGVGHMLGLGVRGVGGRAPGRSGLETYCGTRIRVDLPLEIDYLMTVEPGIYFVPALLDDAGKRAEFKNLINWDALARWRSVGGVRLEDNVLITQDGPCILTEAIAK